jgi:hypothetical protein
MSELQQMVEFLLGLQTEIQRDLKLKATERVVLHKATGVELVPKILAEAANATQEEVAAARQAIADFKSNNLS